MRSEGKVPSWQQDRGTWLHFYYEYLYKRWPESIIFLDLMGLKSLFYYLVSLVLRNTFIESL